MKGLWIFPLVALALLLGSACGGGDSFVSKETQPAGKEEDGSKLEEVEQFALEFVQRVSNGDADWIEQHCSSKYGCDGSWYEKAALCSGNVGHAAGRRHPDPQGQWRVAVMLLPSCTPETDKGPYYCIKVDVEREGEAWKGDIDTLEATEDDCSLDSEWF